MEERYIEMGVKFREQYMRPSEECDGICCDSVLWSLMATINKRVYPPLTATVNRQIYPPFLFRGDRQH